MVNRIKDFSGRRRENCKSHQTDPDIHKEVFLESKETPVLREIGLRTTDYSVKCVLSGGVYKRFI